MSPEAWRSRAKPQLAEGRCCWVCGRVGGNGFTTALRLAGYRVAKGQMAYAHAACMRRAAKEQTDFLRHSPAGKAKGET